MTAAADWLLLASRRTPGVPTVPDAIAASGAPDGPAVGPEPDTLAGAVLGWFARRVAARIPAPPPAPAPDVTGSALDRIARLETTVSQLADKIAEAQRHADAALQRSRDDAAALNARVDDLQGKVATPEDLAALDKLEQTVDAIDPASPVTADPPAPPVIPPAAGPEPVAPPA